MVRKRKAEPAAPAVEWTSDMALFRKTLHEMAVMMIHRCIFELVTVGGRKRICSFLNGYARLFKNIGVLSDHDVTSVYNPDRSLDIVAKIRYSGVERHITYTWHISATGHQVTESVGISQKAE